MDFPFAFAKMPPAKRREVMSTISLAARCSFFVYLFTGTFANLLWVINELLFAFYVKEHPSFHPNVLAELWRWRFNRLFLSSTVAMLACFYCTKPLARALYAVALTLRRGVRWLEGSGNSSASICSSGTRHHPDSSMESQLVAVIPMLLSHLPPAERRALWQVGKHPALQIWSWSSAVQLSLSDCHPIRSWTKQHGPPASSSSHELTPNPLIPLIRSKRPSFLPEGVFFQRIQSLSLSTMQLDASSLESLQTLQTLLPNLKHLSLSTCHIQSAADTASRDSTGTRRQPLLSLHSFSGWESKAAPLVDHQRLRSLGTDDPEIFSKLDSGSFPTLSILRLTSGVVSDAQLDVLLAAKPQMQEVWLTQLRLRRDHSAQACSWGLLRLQGDAGGKYSPGTSHDYSGLYALELALLPLEGIRRLVVERELYAWSSGDATDLALHGCTWGTAWPRLYEAAERLEFEPGISGRGHPQVDLGLTDDEPGFTLHLAHTSDSPASPPSEASSLAAVVARRLQGGTFVYSGCDMLECMIDTPFHSFAAVTPLMVLPSTVHTLVLRECRIVPDDPGALWVRLPLHVEQLVVKAKRVFAVHPMCLREEYRRDQWLW